MHTDFINAHYAKKTLRDSLVSPGLNSSGLVR